MPSHLEQTNMRKEQYEEKSKPQKNRRMRLPALKHDRNTHNVGGQNNPLRQGEWFVVEGIKRRQSERDQYRLQVAQMRVKGITNPLQGGIGRHWLEDRHRADDEVYDSKDGGHSEEWNLLADQWGPFHSQVCRHLAGVAARTMPCAQPKVIID